MLLDNKPKAGNVFGIPVGWVLGLNGGIEGLSGLLITGIAMSLTLTQFDGYMITFLSIFRSVATLVLVANVLGFKTPKQLYNGYLLAAVSSLFQMIIVQTSFYPTATGAALATQKLLFWLLTASDVLRTVSYVYSFLWI